MQKPQKRFKPWILTQKITKNLQRQQHTNSHFWKQNPTTIFKEGRRPKWTLTPHEEKFAGAISCHESKYHV